MWVGLSVGLGVFVPVVGSAEEMNEWMLLVNQVVGRFKEQSVGWVEGVYGLVVDTVWKWTDGCSVACEGLGEERREQMELEKTFVLF